MIFPYFKFAQLAIRPNWYDNLGDAMDEEARVASMRTSAGWEAGEGGWSSPDGINETDWADEGWPFPEDADFATWFSAAHHSEALDAGVNPIPYPNAPSSA